MLPQDFLEEMQSLLGSEYDDFLNSYDNPRLQAFRINRLKSTNIELLGELFGLSKVEWAKDGYYYNPETRPGKHVLHEAGAYYIQEPSAMTPAEYLAAQPGDYILDLCAAPGGKSTQIASSMQGQGILVSNEIVPSRAKILSENIERMGIANDIVTNMDPDSLAEFFPEFFDRIMVDAPCSGEGMFRKNEDATTEWSRDNVHMCAARQDDILRAAAQMLAPGGRMVYSTCTFSPEENEGSIERFLAEHGDFHVVNVDKYPGMSDGLGDISGAIRLWPHKINGEGHFVCVLEKDGELPQHKDRLSKGRLAKGLKDRNLKEYNEFIAENIVDMPKGVIINFGQQLYMLPEGAPSIDGLKVVRPGLHLGAVTKGRFEPGHALTHALPLAGFRNVTEISLEDAKRYIEGQTFNAEGTKGYYVVSCEGYGLSWGKLAGGIMKNHYPKGLRKLL